MVGETDPAINVESISSLVDEIEDFNFKVIPNTGHFLDFGNSHIPCLYEKLFLEGLS